ncbi:MAG: DEAD/DEAH box helicase [Ichthyobacteriaceae bacterium]|nr:DEAD/DEAH box helicase [Ichthyobacteriaceae bacterium]
MEFSDLKLHGLILKAIEKNNYKNPTPVQEKAIPFILNNKDIIVSAQTGTGKTAAYALPILHKLINEEEEFGKKQIKALVICPTRELALQVSENFVTYGRFTGLTTTVIYGGAPIVTQKKILKKGVDVLIATPGRLLDFHKQGVVDFSNVETMVLDESDMMLDMGFINDIKKIEKLCPPKKQMLLLSATMPKKILQLAQSMLKKPTIVEVSPTSSASKNVSQALYYVPKPKKVELFLHLLRTEIEGTILIFRRTKRSVDNLGKILRKNDYNAVSIHGDKTQSSREKALKKFKSKEANILIATDVASRGIDIGGLDVVVNFDLPNVPETFVHRIGRTGRAGKTGKAYSLCSADEKDYIKDIQKLTKLSIPVITDHPYPLDPKAKAEAPKQNQKQSSKKRSFSKEPFKSKGSGSGANKGNNKSKEGSGGRGKKSAASKGQNRR